MSWQRKCFWVVEWMCVKRRTIINKKTKRFIVLCFWEDFPLWSMKTKLVQLSQNVLCQLLKSFILNLHLKPEHIMALSRVITYAKHSKSLNLLPGTLWILLEYIAKSVISTFELWQYIVLFISLYKTVLWFYFLNSSVSYWQMPFPWWLV